MWPRLMFLKLVFTFSSSIMLVFNVKSYFFKIQVFFQLLGPVILGDKDALFFNVKYLEYGWDSMYVYRFIFPFTLRKP